MAFGPFFITGTEKEAQTPVTEHSSSTRIHTVASGSGTACAWSTQEKATLRINTPLHPAPQLPPMTCFYIRKPQLVHHVCLVPVYVVNSRGHTSRRLLGAPTPSFHGGNNCLLRLSLNKALSQVIPSRAAEHQHTESCCTGPCT